MEKYERLCICALNRIFGYNPVIGLRLLEHFGNAENIFKAKKVELAKLMGFGSRYPDSIDIRAVDQAGKELEALSREGILFIPEGDADYPRMLRECEDHPIGIYCRSGSPPETLFNNRVFISVVGTRDISTYGLEWCGKIVEAFAASDVKPVIVSGLALGTDITAHLTALDCGLPTIAVMATGIDEIYPYRHFRHAERIVRSKGSALVTDYPPGTVPLAINFLRRNRIIAGLSSSTILIESKRKGGGILTAQLAFSYDRDVFALPGRIDDVRSEGCNSLIDSDIAKPICSIDSLMRRLGLGRCVGTVKMDLGERLYEIYSKTLGEKDVRTVISIAETIRKKRGITFEELCGELSIPYSLVCRYANMLESDGIIATDLFQRCRLKVKNA